MRGLNPLLMIDGYKADHRRQYPEGTQTVYSNWTPRKSRRQGNEEVIFFGLQYFLMEYLIDRFNEDFFGKPLGPIIDDYRKTMDEYLGEGAVPVDHIEDLHKLGYLPLCIKALPEGTIVPMKVPMFTIRNTHPKFFWLTNQLETILSCELWTPCTSAMTSYLYRKRFEQAHQATGIPAELTKFQGHDFSFRGMSSLESAMISGAGHLLSFAGTDTVPAIKFLQKYYGATGLVGCSVPASEHSCMCAGTKDAEIDTYRRLINEIYPKGIVSIVSDTWDFWSIMTKGLVELKDDIMARDGKVVFRPDSGDPVKIICGDPDAPIGTPENKGAMECLWEVFGGERKGGFRQLDPHVGLIYGDSITLERQDQIIKGLMAKGMAPSVVLGIGSFTYQYVTRDTYGFAMKATWVDVNGEARDIFKDPKTDRGGEKRSARGLIQVYAKPGRVDGDPYEICLKDECSALEENAGLLKEVFLNGKILQKTNLGEIRNLLHGDKF
jgi:nicotinamide phosphoribosyltransferase